MSPYLELSRDILSSYGKVFKYIPVLGLFVNIGFNVWVLIFMLGYLLYKKKYNSMVYLVPSLILVFVCIASPVNTYFRYALPYIFAALLNIGLFIKENE